jgi:hypothetical protein
MGDINVDQVSFFCEHDLYVRTHIAILAQPTRLDGCCTT